MAAITKRRAASKKRSVRGPKAGRTGQAKASPKAATGPKAKRVAKPPISKLRVSAPTKRPRWIPPRDPTSRTAHLEISLPIQAARSRVWQALVGETTHWWPRDFYTNALTKGFHIEPHIGGRVYENAGDGHGLVWYTVVGVEPPRSLMLLGYLFPSFGGPLITMVHITLEGDATATTVRLTDSAIGRVDEKWEECTADGWRQLLEVSFRAYVERGMSAP